MTVRRPWSHSQTEGAAAPSLLGALVVLVAAVVSGAAVAAQESEAATPASRFSEPLACGVVEYGAPRETYFRDLCAAVALAVHGSEDALEVQALPVESMVRALQEGDVPLAFGLPAESRLDVNAVLGPVVLIDAPDRYALAHAEGSADLGETAAWVFFALVQVEAFAEGRAVDEVLATDEFRDFEERLTRHLGLDREAIARTVTALGHHGDIYERHFGEEPGPNRPVELGGQLFAPPVQD